ncbi:LysR family transcriptional regulator [Phaeobacter sp. QD34_3]|uniref:LysR family transcriptional regulator n=1 Tax=unclassified Phaeobacter TaxID=2621772 RepID=UPI00237EFE68|nr:MULTISPECIES: LysR family transcriptional regulator [unclassified Phaeobacter]MDE4134994.1 LysR family transcriptional regulator [Phaeobacter sp. QD34_3]
MKISWDDMQTVLAMVRGGSLAAAGVELGLSYTSVARRIHRAEQALGRPLFERRPEGYQATEEAHDIARAAARMEAEEQAVLRRLSGRAQDLQGPLSLTAPPLLIQSFLAPLLAEFTAQNPQVELTVRAANGVLDLARREADLALRISRHPQDTLVGRKLAEQQSGFFAVPEIAERAALDPQAPLDWVLYSGHEAPPAAARKSHPDIRVRARLDDMPSMIAAALAGMGALRMPVFLAHSHPGLVPLPHLPLQPYAPIWLLSHRDLLGSAKLAALKGVLEPWFRDNKHMFSSLP